MEKRTHQDRLEEASRKFALVQIPLAVKTAGIYCRLYRKVNDLRDEVYGNYGGVDELIPITASSVYSNMDNIGVSSGSSLDLSSLGTLEDGTLSQNTIDVSSGYEVENEFRILLTASQWRIVAGYEGGFLEDSGFAYALTSKELKTGDVVEFDRKDGALARFRVIKPLSLGRKVDIVTRFQLSNIGD